MPDRFNPAAPRHVVVVAHPGARSFNAAVAQAYCDTVRECGQEAILHDLYAMGFDPVLRDAERPGGVDFALSADVAAELEAIRGSDVFVLIYPIWFGMPPAMMKGYVDRVLGAGVTAQDVQTHVGESVLSHKRLFSITSSGAREVWLEEQGQVESLRDVFSHYLAHAFEMTSCEHLHFGGVVEGSSTRFIAQNLSDVHERARKICATVAAERNSARARSTLPTGH